jgi:hypothetical protein
MRMSFLVVGAGLFGSIIAAALRARGASVIVVDDARLEAGSRPAACLMKPGWFSSLGKSVYTPALSMLEELYGVKTIKFKMGIAQVPVKWCDPASILLPADRKDTVKVIRRGRTQRAQAPPSRCVSALFKVTHKNHREQGPRMFETKLRR